MEKFPNHKINNNVSKLFSNNEIPATIAYPIIMPEDILNVLEDKRTIFYIFGYLQYPENNNVKLMMKGIM